MSENILMIVPPIWVKQDVDYICRLTSHDLDRLIVDQNTKILGDFNDLLYAGGYFQDQGLADNIRVADVLVLDTQAFFKFGEI
jgi:hypothetical protein